MQKFFITPEEFHQKRILFDIAFQIKNVLRGKLNDEFLIGVQDKTFLVRITKIESNEIHFGVIQEETGNQELPVFVTLFQGYPKGDKMETIIKTATQLGIYEVCPTITHRSIVKIEEKKRETKIERFQKIACEAAEQSLRNVVPRILDITKLKEIDFSKFDKKIVCYEEVAKNNEESTFRKLISELSCKDKVAIVVGPEGGLTKEEVEDLKEKGFIAVGLGPRILRTETVVSYVLSCISYELELKK